MIFNDRTFSRARPFVMSDNEVLLMGGNRSSLMVLLVVLAYSDEMTVSVQWLLTFASSRKNIVLTSNL